ncbi:MAG: hypothetical protein GX556_04360 [Fibrobacter sp.]|nr:hypothetical protein [Fibrobacter sp.]
MCNKPIKSFIVAVLWISGCLAQLVSDPLPYAPIANPLPDTMSQIRRDSLNIKISRVRVNQAGYRPQDSKYFYYVASGSASTFQVIDASGNPAANGTLTSTGKTTSGKLHIWASDNATIISGGDTSYIMDSPEISGTIFEGKIPELPPGSYRVIVGSDTSADFLIDERIYSWTRDALLKFYGVNRCGDSQSWFHAGCHLKDEVPGGWHDCGDHLKEGATMSYTAAVLGLAAAAFSDRDADVYSANQGVTLVTDGIPDILYEAKHGADFVLRSFDKAGGQPGNMITSVGSFQKDHMWWGRPENQDKMPVGRGGPPREARNEPTTDYLGKYAANLAFVSRLIRPYDPAYADRCLNASKAIYEFTLPRMDRTNTPAYNGGTNVSPDAAFACLGLLWATGERKYLDQLCYDKTIGTLGQNNPKLFQGGLFTWYDPIFYHGTANTDWASSQAHVLWGFFRLVLNDESFCQELGLSENDRLALIEKTIFNLMANVSSVGIMGEQIDLPPNGFWVPATIKYELPWFTMHTQMEWVWNRYQAGNITEMYYYYDIAQRIQGIELPNTPASADWKVNEVKTILIRMMDYMLGVNPWDISMIYGIGDKNYNHPHHRAANPEGKNVPGAFYEYRPPVGALQGGNKPINTSYVEHYDEYHNAETGIDGTTNILMPVIGLAKEVEIKPPTGTVRILYVGCDNAIVEVRQSRYGKSVIRYGEGETTGLTAASDSSDVLHRFVLSGLKEGTVYSFDAVVTDVYGRESVLKNINDERQEVNFTFTTGQNCPTNADIENVKVCKVTSDSAEIFWYTPNGEFDSRVVFGEQIPPATEQYGDISGHPTKFHYVKIGGLKEKTTYYFYVESGDSRDDNMGSYYKFTTPVEHVKFDVRTLRYYWDDIPSLGVNIVNQDSKAYDSLDVRIYFRGKEGFEKLLGARLDICVLYHEDGYQAPIEGELRDQIWRNLVNQKPQKMEDTYDPSDETYVYYLSLPLWGVEMRSQSRIRLDVMFVRWEPERGIDQLDDPTLHTISDRDWSFGPHSTANGEPVDYPGVPELPKNEVDRSYPKQPINYYVTIYRKEQYVWGYSPSKEELATKKTHFELTSQITSPINNPTADYHLYEGSAKTLTVGGHAKVTPFEGKINDIWVNGVRQPNPSSLVTWNESNQNYDFNIPVPVKNGRNPVDITLFAGPSVDCEECFGCAVTNHSFFLDAPFIQQYPSHLSVKDINFEAFGDTVKIDTTVFHVIVTDKNGNKNKSAKDTLWASVFNPTNRDSSVVRLVETADSSNVFQTEGPVSVVNIEASLTGPDQISMSGGDMIWVRYMDPSDSTDTASISLFSKADFPVALLGSIFDMNGDGMIDELQVEYTTALKALPDSFDLFFPNASSRRVIRMPSDSIAITAEKTARTYLRPYLQQGLTGFSTGMSGKGTSFITHLGTVRSSSFQVQDKAGPVLTGVVFLHERNGAGDDTLTVTFSEVVNFSSSAGSLVLNKISGESPVDVKAIIGSDPTTNTYTIIASGGAVQILEGDSLSINPAGTVTDFSNNHAHLQNIHVPVVLKALPPRISDAVYKDIDYDGMIDFVRVTFQKNININALALALQWKTDGIVNIPLDSMSYMDTEQKTVGIKIEGLLTGTQIVTGGNMRVSASVASFPDNIMTCDIIDSAAPVIVSGLFSPSETDENGDTLTIEFSEVVSVAESEPFIAQTASGEKYSFKVKFLRRGDDTRQVFLATINGTAFPSNSDSIRINTLADIYDNSAVYQKSPENRNAPLKVRSLSFTIKVEAGPNPFLAGGSIIADNGELPAGFAGQTGILFKVTPVSRVVATGEFSGTVEFFDQLGNRVYKGNLVRGNGQSSTMYFNWSGRNMKGRYVGEGVYRAVVTVSKTDGKKEVTMIKVAVKR